MQKQKIVPGEWVVVCDGSKVLILQNVGDARFPNLKTKEVREEKHALTREIGSDEPGKVQQSVARRAAATSRPTGTNKRSNVSSRSS